jgi:PiT family inorganic phosphate transporter
MTLSWILVAVVIVALVFDYTNGFHDAANAIATSIGTRALQPTTALAMAAVLNVVGGVVYETKVAKTVSDLIDPGAATLELVLAALLGAILWNLVTWWLGIPSSSSHALTGGLIGATLAATSGTSAVRWTLVLQKVVLPTIASPLIGFVLAVLVTTVLYRLVHGGVNLLDKVVMRLLGFALVTAFFGFVFRLVVGEPLHHFAGVELSPFWFALPGAIAALWVLPDVIGRGPAEVNGRFRLLQTLSAGYMALEHGHNDAQKTMGIITLALIGSGRLGHADGTPVWVKLACALVIGLGTFSGGKRIIKTMGMKLVKLEPIDGFAAETVAGSVIQLAGTLGMPISTTHAITAAITGVGATKRISAVRWGVTTRILYAWLLTLPAAGLVSAGCWFLLHALV